MTKIEYITRFPYPSNKDLEFFPTFSSTRIKVRQIHEQKVQERCLRIVGDDINFAFQKTKETEWVIDWKMANFLHDSYRSSKAIGRKSSGHIFPPVNHKFQLKETKMMNWTCIEFEF